MSNQSIAILFFTAIVVSSGAFGQTDFTLDLFNQSIQSNCAYCHGGDEPAGNLVLEPLDSIETISDQVDQWLKVLHRVEAREMPPKFVPALDDEHRSELTHWLKQAIDEMVCGDAQVPGPAPVRRLNRNEYAATIRDLLGIHFNAGHDLPEDGAGGAGFDNAAETLFISPVHLERYFEAAREALDYAVADAGARRLLFIAQPGDSLSETDAARTILERFASRAFRRPVKEDELQPLLALFQAAFKRDGSFEEAVLYAMRAVLISPNFLFLIETPNTTSMVRPVNDYELACRLSYFLWSSMPDDELFALAKNQELHRAGVLEEQIDRMLSEPSIGRRSRSLEDLKSQEFAQNFVSQWLGTRELGRNLKPDQRLFKQYNQDLEASMRYEPVYFFHRIVDENLSLLNLIDSDFTYVSERLARLYGIDKQVEVNNQQMNFIHLPAGSHRGGVMTMAGVLAVSSYPHRTSPVLRGKWVLDSLLGTPPPPPPPNVPPLPEVDDQPTPTTVRERLTQHRQNPVCASCHDRIDPIGFGLENFDAIGRWRTEDHGKRIDASGTLPDGRTFDGPEELRKVLMDNKDLFIRNLTVKMMSYALGRGLTLEDQCTVDMIVETLQSNDYKARTLIAEIVKSIPFRYRRAHEAPVGYGDDVVVLSD
ncbi:MAG: DUF1592 domain-containing protein [bacterium]|nr:DUF1592 domain-containing protein [bacterium]